MKGNMKDGGGEAGLAAFLVAVSDRPSEEESMGAPDEGTGSSDVMERRVSAATMPPIE